MRYAATFALMILVLRITQAQEIGTIHMDKSSIFSLYTGLANYIERDDAMSPFKYKGQSMPIEISYRISGSNYRQSFYANFDNTKLKSSLPNYENAGLNHYVQGTNIQMGYSYLRRTIKLTKYKSDIFLGGEINFLLNLRRHAYINNNEFLMLDQFNSLGFKAQLEKRFANNKQFAFISLSIPLVSYVFMGDIYNAYVGNKIDPLVNYSGNILLYLAKRGDFVSFNRLVYFKTDISFVHFIGSNIGIEGKYSLRYYKYTQYKDVNYSKNLQYQFLIGIIGKF